MNRYSITNLVTGRSYAVTDADIPGTIAEWMADRVKAYGHPSRTVPETATLGDEEITRDLEWIRKEFGDWHADRATLLDGEWILAAEHDILTEDITQELADAANAVEAALDYQATAKVLLEDLKDEWVAVLEANKSPGRTKTIAQLIADKKASM